MSSLALGTVSGRLRTDVPRVLVVEDDLLLREAYRTVLVKAGFEVIEASEGRNAIALIERAGPSDIDLVVLDMGLPDMAGLDVLAYVRNHKDDPDLPVLIVTGADELAQRVEGLARGAQDYIVKPVALAELVARVEAHIRTTEHWRNKLSALSDLAFMGASVMRSSVGRERAAAARCRRHAATIADRTFATVFQPIVDLISGRAVGYEALTRFPDGSRPDLVFADAGEVNMRSQLEQATAFAALERAAPLPAGTYLSVNLSAETALDTAFLAHLETGDRPIVLEITEHDAVEDYHVLGRALDTIRPRVQLAVDDVGAGYSSLSHIRSLRPDIIKLDRSLVSGLDSDPAGRAVVAGMVHFAREIGCRVVGEGIETDAEARVLAHIGVSLGQGFLLGRPQEVAQLTGSA